MADEAARPIGAGYKDILDNEENAAAEDLKRIQAGADSEESSEVPPAEPEGAAESPTTTPTAPPSQPEPAAAAPAEPEKKEGQGEPWRLLRAKERENKELSRRLEALERQAADYDTRVRGQQPATTPEVPDFNTDPALNLKHGLETAEQRMARLEAEQQRTQTMLAQQAELSAVRAQEETFTRERPDYPQAIQHLITSELEEFRMGPKASVVGSLNQALMNGDQIVRRAVDSLASQGMDDDAAIGAIAEQTYINNRAQMLREAARAMGKSVPELGYAFAQRRGYQPQGATPATAAAPAQSAEQAEAALARVRQAQQISRGAQTLSEMDTTAPRQERRFSRKDVINMNESELDQLLAGDEHSWYREG